MLLRARHWLADFVNLYGSLSLPHVAQVAPLLPTPGTRWIVFRDAEYPPQTYTASGKVYGHSGETGPWADGIRTDGATPLREGTGFGFDRWVLTATAPLVLTLPGAADDAYVVTIWRPDGSRETVTGTVVGQQLTLAPGRYHRVDVGEPAPLTIEERVQRLETRVAALEAAGMGSEKRRTEN